MAAPAPAKKDRVALVVPAWNEEGSIGAVLSEVPPDLVDWVFVVVGDSTDGTAAVARDHGAQVLGQHRPGYGAACYAGAQAAARAGAGIVAFIDGDYSDPPAALPLVLAPLLAGQADLVLGWRQARPQARSAAAAAQGVRGEPHPLPLHARAGNWLVVTVLGAVLGGRLRDLPSFKAIRIPALESLQLREMTYGWTTELVVKSVRAGLRIVEVPIAYRPRLAGASKVSGTLRGSVGAAWKLCSCAARYARWTPPASSP